MENNGGEGILVEGVENIITGNHVHKNAGIGVSIVGDSCVVSNNVTKDNTDGIRVAGEDSVISGNVCQSNSLDGVHVATGATDNIVTYNNLQSNTGTNLADNGTTTEATGNKV